MPNNNRHHYSSAFRCVSSTCLLLLVLQVVLVLGSWIVRTIDPASTIRSLMSGEGIRWYIGHFASLLASPLLVDMLLCALAYGVWTQGGMSRVCQDVRRGEQLSYRRHHALYAAAVVWAVLLLLTAWLTLSPHALLLSVTGTLADSSFSRGLIPLLAFAFTFSSMAYGLSAGILQSWHDVMHAMCRGLSAWAPAIVLYLFATQGYHALCYVCAW